VNNYGKEDHSLLAIGRRKQQVPRDKLPFEPSFGWVGRTNFGGVPYKLLGNNERVHDNEENINKADTGGYSGIEVVDYEDDNHFVSVGYYGDQLLKEGHGGYQGEDDHRLEGGHDGIKIEQSVYDRSTFQEDDEQFLHNDSNQAGVSHSYTDDDIQSEFGENSEFDRQDNSNVYQLEFGHSQNNEFLLPGHERDNFALDFTSNQIYNGDEEGGSARLERSFDNSERFLPSFGSFDDTERSHQHQGFGFEEQSSDNIHVDGFGKDDLFFKPKVSDRSSDFDEFYQPQYDNSQGYGNGKQQRYPGRINEAHNGQQRSSQEFGDIFGVLKTKPISMINFGF